MSSRQYEWFVPPTESCFTIGASSNDGFLFFSSGVMPQPYSSVSVMVCSDEAIFSRDASVSVVQLTCVWRFPSRHHVTGRRPINKDHPSACQNYNASNDRLLPLTSSLHGRELGLATAMIEIIYGLLWFSSATAWRYEADNFYRRHPIL